MMGITGFLFSVCGEKKPDNGEDSFVYALNESRAMVGVLDGGPGAGQSPALKGKSGGYLASRAAAAAYLHWFEALQPGQENGAEDVKERLRQYLRLCREQAGADFAGRLSASGAAAICRPARGGADVQLQWAGDSRVYLLDGAGLAQLTEDDMGGLDACTAEEKLQLWEHYKAHYHRLLCRV